MTRSPSVLVKALCAGVGAGLLAWMIYALMFGLFSGKRFSWWSVGAIAATSLPAVVAGVSVATHEQRKGRSMVPTYQQATQRIATQMLEDAVLVLQESREQEGFPPIDFRQTIDAYFSEANESDNSVSSSPQLAVPNPAPARIGSSSNPIVVPTDLGSDLTPAQMEEIFSGASSEMPEDSLSVNPWSDDAWADSSDRDLYGDSPASSTNGTTTY